MSLGSLLRSSTNSLAIIRVTVILLHVVNLNAMVPDNRVF